MSVLPWLGGGQTVWIIGQWLEYARLSESLQMYICRYSFTFWELAYSAPMTGPRVMEICEY